MRHQQHQPMKKQPNPDQSNSWLPIRPARPRKFPNRRAQQRNVPPDPTPSVPVKTRPDRPMKVKFDGGDVTNKLPAGAVGLRAGRILVDSTGSNPEDHVGLSSVSPVLSDVRLIRPVTDGISASKFEPTLGCPHRTMVGDLTRMIYTIRVTKRYTAPSELTRLIVMIQLTVVKTTTTSEPAMKKSRRFG